MSWWRKEQDDKDNQDDILDLNTVVWRSAAPAVRPEDFASTENHQVNQGAEHEKNYIPTKPLPSDPFPVQHITQFVDETKHSNPTSENMPDASDAIKTIVADEIGDWLNNNIRRIITESVSAALPKTKPEELPKTRSKKKAKKSTKTR